MKSKEKKILFTLLVIGGPAGLVFGHSALHAMISSLMGFIAFVAMALAWFAAVVYAAGHYDDDARSSRRKPTMPGPWPRAAESHSPTCERHFTIFAVDSAGVTTMTSLQHVCRPTPGPSRGPTTERA